VNSVPRTLTPKIWSKCSSVVCSSVHPLAPGADRVVEPVQVGQVRDVAPHRGSVADGLDRRVQLGLAPAGDEDVRPLCRETPGCGEADATAPTGHDRRLALELSHCRYPPQSSVPIGTESDGNTYEPIGTEGVAWEA
jgi:hypothetical protein